MSNSSPTRMILFIGIAIYLIGLGFLLPEMNKALSSDNQIEYDTTGSSLTSGTEEFNFVSSIQQLPLWFNTIFIVIPFIAEILIGITLFFPTGNAGA